MIALLVCSFFFQHSYLSQYFTHLSGNNGFEEYFQAVDQLEKSPEFGKLEAAVAHAINESDESPEPREEYLSALRKEVTVFARSAQLIEVGNNKSAVAPKQFFGGAWDAVAYFPVLAQFKRLARLNADRAYLEFAEGKSRDAVSALLDDFQMGRNISQGVLIMRLVGLACEAIGLAQLDRHLDQLSLEDVQAIERYCQFELNAPNPGIECLLNEGKQATQSVTSIMRQTTTEALEDFSDDEALKKQLTALTKLSPSERDLAIEQACQKIQNQVKSYATALGSSESEWKSCLSSASDVEPTSIGDAVATLLAVPGDGWATAEIRFRVKIHLLDLKCKVIEYRWRNGHLPATLSAAATAPETRDEICGGDFIYTVKGDRFEVKSRGIEQTGEITVRTVRKPSVPATDPAP